MCCSLPAMAWNSVDSLSCFDRAAGSRAFKITYPGVPFMIGGMAIYGADGNLKDAAAAGTHVRNYGTQYEDYLQYAPGVALLALKLGGVDGRSSWPRMLTSDAFSAVMTVGGVELLKRSVGETRPDGEDNRAFPSGHAAISFMLATMLHKEYGCRSPWISLGGYTIATATAASRVAHNCHWTSNVLVGAGLGIVATELGYYFADLIFKDKGLSELIYADPLDRWRNPSFIATDLAMNIPLTSYSLPAGEVRQAIGTTAGLQGAYFFNPYVGIGGSTQVAVMPIECAGTLAQEPMNAARLMAGAYFSYPVFSQLRLGAKVAAGYIYYGGCRLTDDTEIGGKSAAGMEVGVSASLLTAESFGFRLFCDYGIGGSYVNEAGKPSQTLSVGGSAAIYF